MTALLIALNVATLILVGVVLYLQSCNKTSSLKNNFDSIDKNLDKVDRLIREELAQSRAELNSNLNNFRQSLSDQISQFAKGKDSIKQTLLSAKKNQIFSEYLSTLRLKADLVNNIPTLRAAADQ